MKNGFMKGPGGGDLVELGKKYKDSIHGFKGVAICVTRHVTGCDQVCLQRENKKDGKLEERWLDVTRIEGINIPEGEHKSGGPQLTPPID